MYPHYRESEWNAIRIDIDEKAARGKLAEMKRNHPWLEPFEGWESIAIHIHGLSPDSAEKDQFFRAIFGDARAQGMNGWRSIVLAIFWPDLLRIYKNKVHWDHDNDRRWANLIWAYYGAADRLDPAVRLHALSKKLFNDTAHDLYEHYKAEWDLAKREVPTDPFVIADEYDSPVFDDMSLRSNLSPEDAALSNLQDHLQAGRITQPDYFLILGTRIYGHSLATCADQAGLSYHAAKKRRHRAEAKVRAYNSEKRIS